MLDVRKLTFGNYPISKLQNPTSYTVGGIISLIVNAETLKVPIDGQEVKDKGYRIKVHSLSKIKKRMRARSVARHEAKHAFVALETGTDVIIATNLPSVDGSLGHVITSEFNAMAAAAPHATGEEGTGMDVFIIERSGHSLSSAESGAKSVLSGNEDVVEVTASLIEEKGSVGGGEIKEEIRNFRDEKTNGKSFIVEVTTPEGQTQKIFKSGIHEGEGIEVPMDELLPKAA